MRLRHVHACVCSQRARVGRAWQSTDLAVVGVPVRDSFVAFANETGRKVRTETDAAPILRPHFCSRFVSIADTTQLHLEIEPGTFLLANSCSIVSTIQARAPAHHAVCDFAFCRLTFAAWFRECTGHRCDVVARVPEAGRGHDGSAAPLAVRVGHSHLLALCVC
jgi:hypothetical protein